LIDIAIEYKEALMVKFLRQVKTLTVLTIALLISAVLVPPISAQSDGGYIDFNPVACPDDGSDPIYYQAETVGDVGVPNREGYLENINAVPIQPLIDCAGNEVIDIRPWDGGTPDGGTPDGGTPDGGTPMPDTPAKEPNLFPKPSDLETKDPKPWCVGSNGTQCK
jgi:hypothetical protein